MLDLETVFQCFCSYLCRNWLILIINIHDTISQLFQGIVSSILDGKPSLSPGEIPSQLLSSTLCQALALAAFDLPLLAFFEPVS